MMKIESCDIGVFRSVEQARAYSRCVELMSKFRTLTAEAERLDQQDGVDLNCAQGTIVVDGAQTLTQGKVTGEVKLGPQGLEDMHITQGGREYRYHEGRGWFGLGALTQDYMFVDGDTVERVRYTVGTHTLKYSKTVELLD